MRVLSWGNPTSTTGGRRHELDWLRALIVLGLVPIHSATLFSAASDIQVKNAQTSRILDLTIGLMSAWAMPTLFLVSGAGAWFAISARSPNRYLNDRFTRLFLPFVFATVVLIPIEVYAVAKADPGLLSTVNVPLPKSHMLDSYVSFYPVYLISYGYFLAHYSVGLVPIFWAHLWFLPRLLVVSLIALPLLLLLRGIHGRAIVSRLRWLYDRPHGILLFAIPVAMIRVLFGSGWLNNLTASWPIYDQWDQFLLFFLFFLLGCLIYADPHLLRQVRSSGNVALLGGIALWVVAQRIPPPSYHAPFAAVPAEWLFLPLRSMIPWLLGVGVLSVAVRFFQRTNRLGAYINDAAFPIYVLHLPIILVIGAMVVDWQTSLFIKFAVVVLGSFLTLTVLYEGLIKRTPMIRVLFGMKPHPAPARAQSCATYQMTADVREPADMR